MLDKTLYLYLNTSEEYSVFINDIGEFVNFGDSG